MPPTEHALIDELAYRGARVVCSHAGGEHGIWLVVKGRPLSRKARKIWLELLDEQLEFEAQNYEARRRAELIHEGMRRLAGAPVFPA